MGRWLRGLWRELALLLWRGGCAICGRRTPAVFCPRCQAEVLACRLQASLAFEVPAGTLTANQPASVVEGGDGLPLLAWGHYRDRLRSALFRLKYRDCPHVGLLLGRWLGQAWQEAQLERVWGRPVVVPIPLHARRLNERGYNQATAIARGFCRQTRLPLAPDALRRRRETAAQFGLGAVARERNLADAFEVGSLRSRRVLLVDDIYTTGSTVRAAARALQARGITVVGVVAVARAGRGGPRQGSRVKF